MHPPDHMSDYQNRFGYFAHVILTGVAKERQTASQQASSSGGASGLTPFAAQLQQYQMQKHKQQQRRQSVSTVQPTPQPGIQKLGQKDPTTPVFSQTFTHGSLSHTTSMPVRARSPSTTMLSSNTPTSSGLIVGAQRIRPAVASPAIQHMTAQSTPSNSPGANSGTGHTYRIYSAPQQQQQQQKP